MIWFQDPSEPGFNCMRSEPRQKVQHEPLLPEVAVSQWDFCAYQAYAPLKGLTLKPQMGTEKGQSPGIGLLSSIS